MTPVVQNYGRVHHSIPLRKLLVKLGSALSNKCVMQIRISTGPLEN